MSAQVSGQKRKSAGGRDGNKDQAIKYTKSHGATDIKRHKPSHSASRPFTGKQTDKKPHANGKARENKSEDAKRRKRPITSGGGEEDENDQDEDEAMAVDEVKAETEHLEERRPRMTKTERAALHAAQPHRTALLPSHPLLQDKLLPLWEVARRAEMSSTERKKAVAELWDAVKGRVGQVSRGHKGGRVLQTVG